MREVSTTEVMMTDPTTPEGQQYWQERHDHEEALEQTDQDLIVGHPFQGTGQWGDVCEREDGNGWICGYGRAEHADRGEEEP